MSKIQTAGQAYCAWSATLDAESVRQAAAVAMFADKDENGRSNADICREIAVIRLTDKAKRDATVDPTDPDQIKTEARRYPSKVSYRLTVGRLLTEWSTLADLVTVKSVGMMAGCKSKGGKTITSTEPSLALAQIVAYLGVDVVTVLADKVEDDRPANPSDKDREPREAAALWRDLVAMVKGSHVEPKAKDEDKSEDKASEDKAEPTTVALSGDLGPNALLEAIGAADAFTADDVAYLDQWLATAARVADKVSTIRANLDAIAGKDREVKAGKRGDIVKAA